MNTQARQHDAHLNRVLDGLVTEGVLTRQQADQVRLRVAQPKPAEASAGLPAAPVSAPPGPTVSGQEPHPAGHEPLRQRLLEAAVYVGIAFVVTAIAVVIARSWSSITHSGQIVLTTALALLALGAGTALARPIRQDTVRPGLGGMRHRSASALLTAGAVLGAGDAALIVDHRDWSGFAAGLTVALLMVLAHLLAPSLLTEVALFAAAWFCSTTTAERVLPQLEMSFDEDQIWRRQALFALFPLSVGAFWAWFMSRKLRYRLVAVSLGLLILIVFALSMDIPRRIPGSPVLALVAVAALVTYLRTSEWPWVIGAVAAAALWLVQQAGDTLGPAIVFLLIGLLLLAGVAVITVVERRRRRRDHAGAGHVAS